MLRFILAAAVAAVIAIWSLIGSLADASVSRAIQRDAVDKALHWGLYTSTRVPNLAGLIRSGRPTPAQAEAIQQTRWLGDVFRFKLFDADGRLVLVSDEAPTTGPLARPVEIDTEASQVIATGRPLVEVFDGTGKPDRPELYAEAYIRLHDSDGTPIGVAEVYVDETKTRDYFTESFKEFGAIISTVSALLFLVPAVGFGIQRSLAQRSRTEVEYLAKFDPLTGLLNRTEFKRRATSMIRDARMGALLFLDADRFKAINDSYGHAAGDLVLEKIGRILAAETDPGDLVARFGGDEFVIAYTSADPRMVIQRVRTILHRCAAPIDHDGRMLSTSVSVGVCYPGQSRDLDEALAHSDAALYFAKSAGRNQYAVYGEDMGEEIRRRNVIEDRVKKAALRDEFTLAYQPLVSSRTHEIIGYEALMRLALDDGTPVPPTEFIPVAEELGVIDDIGAWALRTATLDIAGLPGALKISVNLSVAQFRSGRLPALIAAALAESGLPSARLELEITESLLLDDNPDVSFQIDAMQEMGVSIAMDDFGTGFSSLGYLWRYGFNRIKIDRSFIVGLSHQSKRSMEIIESVVMLGKRLGMQVTAEGVETAEQSAILSSIGCDVLQGYYFGRPGPLRRDAALAPRNGAENCRAERRTAG